MKHVLLCIPVVLALGATPALAQSGDSGKATTVSSCTTIGSGGAAAALASCKAAIAAYVQALKDAGKSQSQINGLLGALVYELATSPLLAGNKIVQTLVADAITEVAAKIPDPTQRQAIQAVATQIKETGSANTDTLQSAQSASVR